MPTSRVPLLSIISPTYNERPNMRPLVDAIETAMGDTDWELIVVDDDSADRTFEEAAALAREGRRVRCLRRIGRRGLASAVVEGALTSHAEFIAVIDADLQHDERLLPEMLSILRSTDVDLVIGSRVVGQGSFGTLATSRLRMSRFAARCSTLLIGAEVADPMSGFFAMRHSVFQNCLYNLSQQGYKILLDVLTSSPTKLKFVELPYTFRERRAGASKLDAMIVVEYLFLLIEKLTRGVVPPKFVMFSIVGGIGLIIHLTILHALLSSGTPFLPAQAAATVCAMTVNFLVNNYVTYANQRLRGWSLLIGYALFCLACSIGAFANLGVASLAIRESGSWSFAGIAGAITSAVFNFGAAARLIWGRKRHVQQPLISAPPIRTIRTRRAGGNGLTVPYRPKMYMRSGLEKRACPSPVRRALIGFRPDPASAWLLPQLQLFGFRQNWISVIALRHEDPKNPNRKSPSTMSASAGLAFFGSSRRASII